MRKVRRGVAKFGGSSVADHEGMQRCAEIIKSNDFYSVIVLSATAKTTNQLETIAEISKVSIPAAIYLYEKNIFNRHKDIALRLKVYTCLEDVFKEFSREVIDIISRINKTIERYYLPLMDQLYSIGERLSAQIFCAFLNLVLDGHVQYIDARKFIKTDNKFTKANPIISDIKDNTIALVSDNCLTVTSGFIGETLDGQTTTLGREGSDFSGALIAEAIDADFLEIWTDVAGIASIDPDLEENFRFIPQIPYDKATILAKSGAKVLFPRTLEPAKRKSIPVWVKSSKNPKLEGTLIIDYREVCPSFYAVTREMNGHFHWVSVVGHLLDELVDDWESYLKEFEISYKHNRRRSSHMVFELSPDDSLTFMKLLHEKFICSDTLGERNSSTGHGAVQTSPPPGHGTGHTRLHVRRIH